MKLSHCRELTYAFVALSGLRENRMDYNEAGSNMVLLKCGPHCFEVTIRLAGF